MASPSDASGREAVVRKQSKGAPFKFLVPLIYAPVLPLIRLSLRKNPVVRDRLFTLVLAGAFAHGFYLVRLLLDACLVVILSEQIEPHDLSELRMCLISTDIYDAESK